MSDYWNDKGLYCVENCKDRGMPITAMYMKEIVQQRAELLEALKLADQKVVKMYDGITCGCGEDYAKIDEDSIAIREAITNTEATK